LADATGWDEPTDSAWANAIEALIGIGQLHQAGAYLEAYEARAGRAASPWALATAARRRGLLCAAGGDLPRTFAAFDDAVARHDRMRAPFEHARTLLAPGSARRRARQKRATRDTLEHALAISRTSAHRCGPTGRGTSSAGSADGEPPRATSPRARSTSPSSPAKAANKETAAALHISVHTVEAHLSRVYRKLGVRSRTELAHRAKTAGSAAPQSPDAAAKV
jgi:hypothetical protein